jgi:hypothetical protein
MLNKVLLTVALATLTFSGCSDSPKNAKAVAIEICELAKTDIQGLVPYIGDPKMKKEVEQASAMIEMAKNSEMGKKMLAQQMEKAKKINCSEATKMTENSDGTFKVGNQETSQTFTLKMSEGSWKMYQ